METLKIGRDEFTREVGRVLGISAGVFRPRHNIQSIIRCGYWTDEDLPDDSELPAMIARVRDMENE